MGCVKMFIFRRSPMALSLADDPAPAVRPRLGKRATRWQANLLRLWGRIWCGLTCPSQQLKTLEDQIQARLLSIVLLIGFPVVVWLGWVTEPSSLRLIISPSTLTILVLCALLIAYGFSRTRHYRIAVWVLTAAMFMASLVGSAVNYSPETVLYFSMTALVVTAFWSLWPALRMIVAINLYVLVGLPLLMPGDMLSTMLVERSFVVTISAVIGVIAVARHLAMQHVAQQTERLIAAEKDHAALVIERQRTQVLRQFVQNASHDIRTPLSSIRLSLELLDATLYEEQKPRLEKLRQQTHHLERILLDMLELTQLDATDQLVRKPVDLVKLVAYVHDRASQEAQHFNHTFVYESGSDDLAVLADDHYLERAIKGIVENALHYTNHGGTITLRTYAQDGHAVIEVADNGIGIAASEIPLIFERFYRVDSARNTTSGRAGLGLAITKHIVALHDGRIDVESTLGIGSIFRIVIPQTTRTPGVLLAAQDGGA